MTIRANHHAFLFAAATLLAYANAAVIAPDTDQGLVTGSVQLTERTTGMVHDTEASRAFSTFQDKWAILGSRYENSATIYTDTSALTNMQTLNDANEYPRFGSKVAIANKTAVVSYDQGQFATFQLDPSGSEWNLFSDSESDLVIPDMNITENFKEIKDLLLVDDLKLIATIRVLADDNYSEPDSDEYSSFASDGREGGVDLDTNEIFVFTRHNMSAFWELQAQIRTPNDVMSIGFGNGLAFDGDRLLACDMMSGNRGAFMFEPATNGSSIWNLVSKLDTPMDIEPTGSMDCKVDYLGETAVLSSGKHGFATVLQLDHAATNATTDELIFEEVATFMDTNAGGADEMRVDNFRLGFDVAILTEEMVAVSDPLKDVVHIFVERSAGSWRYKLSVKAPVNAIGDHFGTFVKKISSENMLIGAMTPITSVFVFSDVQAATDAVTFAPTSSPTTPPPTPNVTDPGDEGEVEEEYSELEDTSNETAPYSEEYSEYSNNEYEYSEVDEDYNSSWDDDDRAYLAGDVRKNWEFLLIGVGGATGLSLCVVLVVYLTGFGVGHPATNAAAATAVPVNQGGLQTSMWREARNARNASRRQMRRDTNPI